MSHTSDGASAAFRVQTVLHAVTSRHPNLGAPPLALCAAEVGGDAGVALQAPGKMGGLRGHLGQKLREFQNLATTAREVRKIPSGLWKVALSA